MTGRKLKSGQIPDGDVRLTANIRQDLHFRVKVEAARRRISIGELIERMIIESCDPVETSNEETVTMRGIRELIGGSLARVRQWKRKGWLPAPLIAGIANTRRTVGRPTEWSLYVIEQFLARQSHIRKIRETSNIAKWGKKAERPTAAVKLQQLEKELIIFDLANPKSIPEENVLVG